MPPVFKMFCPGTKLAFTPRETCKKNISFTTWHQHANSPGSRSSFRSSLMTGVMRVKRESITQSDELSVQLASTTMFGNHLVRSSMLSAHASIIDESAETSRKPVIFGWRCKLRARKTDDMRCWRSSTGKVKDSRTDEAIGSWSCCFFFFRRGK